MPVLFLRTAFLGIALIVAPALINHAPATASGAEEKAQVLPVDPAPLVAQTQAGSVQFSIEIADDPFERARGLMFRKDMPDDRGMLFVFDDAQQVGFWMKNTPLALDMIFIRENGVIASIQQAEPFSETVVSANEPIRFVLELKAGTAEAKGLKAGDRISHPSMADAAGGQ